MAYNSGEYVKAGVRAAVRLVLRRKKVKPDQFERILGDVMSQAVALYEGWPVGV